MGKNQLIHGNEFHLLKQAEIHKATGKLVESLNLAAGSTGGFDIYKVVEKKEIPESDISFYYISKKDQLLTRKFFFQSCQFLDVT